MGRALRTPHHLHPSDHHTFIPNPSTHPSQLHLTHPISIKMSSFRVAAPKMASMAAQSSVKVARPAFQAAQLQKFTRAYSAVPKNTVFNTMKRTQMMARQASPIAKRAYSSEMANALVQVSQNIGMGSAAIGLAGVGIGLVFAALINAVARNPSLRGQLFSYAILGFAFVEAIGLFDLMVAMMAKFL